MFRGGPFQEVEAGERGACGALAHRPRATGAGLRRHHKRFIEPTEGTHTRRGMAAGQSDAEGGCLRIGVATDTRQSRDVCGSAVPHHRAPLKTNRAGQSGRVVCAPVRTNGRRAVVGQRAEPRIPLAATPPAFQVAATLGGRRLPQFAGRHPVLARLHVRPIGGAFARVESRCHAP